MDTTLADVIAADARAVAQVRKARAAAEQMKAEAWTLAEEDRTREQRAMELQVSDTLAALTQEHQAALDALRARAAEQQAADRAVFAAKRAAWLAELSRKVVAGDDQQ